VKCPRCGADNDHVVDSRQVRDGQAIRRRRECDACGERFTTYETAEAHTQLVVKRDGRREQYDRSKIVAGIARACEKRPVPLARMEQIVDQVEREMAAGFQREVPASRIGELVMARLREVDQVA